MKWYQDKLGKKVGFRYLKAKKSSSFLSLITVISVGGILVGVLTLIVTLGVMSGFESELKNRLFQAETHVLIEPKNSQYFEADPSGATVAEISGYDQRIQSVTQVLQAEAIVRTGKKVAGALLKGVDQKQLEWVEGVTQEKSDPEYLNGFANSERVYLGQELAFNLGAATGDRITVVSPVESEGPFGAIPRVKQFVIAGIYKTGVPDQEIHTIFLPISGVESFLKRDKILSQIEIKLSELSDSEEVASKLSEKLSNIEKYSNFHVRSWQELNEHLFRSLKLERIAMFSILLFIVIVASFNIMSTLTMMVIEKKKSLSILRAMGATPKQISNIFIWEGIAIGITGVGLGLILSLFISFILKSYQVVELPEYYYDRTLPVVVDPVAISFICLSALIIVFLGSIIPSKKASLMTPLEGIRDSR